MDYFPSQKQPIRIFQIKESGKKQVCAMSDTEIRKASLDDLLQLQKIGIKTFSETFSEGNTRENMMKYLEEGFSAAKLSSELKNSNSEFYFAISNNITIGYLKLNFGEAQTELKDDLSLEIERIYVLKEFQGNRIGKLLFEKAIQVAKQKNVKYLWLGVWEENTKAINFYKRNGFLEFDKHIFRFGSEDQTDILMKMKLPD